MVDEEYLYLVFQKNIVKFHIPTGKVEKSISIPIKSNGKALSILNPFLYIRNDEDLVNINEHYDALFSIFTFNEFMVGITADLNTVSHNKADLAHVGKYFYDDFLFVTKDDKTYIMDEGKVITHILDLNSRSSVIYDRFYNITENTLITFPWSEF